MSPISDLHDRGETATAGIFLLDSFWQPLRAIDGTRPRMPSEHPQAPLAARRQPRNRNPLHRSAFGPLTRVQAAQNQ